MSRSTSSTSSGRERLSRERVLVAAEALLRADGVTGLSIRRLAGRLGVSPMAIYRYVPGKEALLSALFNRFIRDARVLPEQPVAWDDWIRHVGLRMYRAQVENPAWTGLLGSLQMPSHGLDVLQACLDVLGSAGFTDEQALDGFFAMVHASMGAGVLQRGFSGLDLDSAIAADGTPSLTALLPRLSNVQRILQGQQVNRSLELLIAGMRQQRQPGRAR